MSPWAWFVVVVALGAACLAFAIFLDNRKRKETFGDLTHPAPLRHHPTVDAIVPRYITQDEIDRLPRPSSQDRIEPTAPDGTVFNFGYAHADFSNSARGANLDAPRVLLVDGTITTMRELFPALNHSDEQYPLVIGATSFAPEVLTTLAANRKALELPLLAFCTDSKTLGRLAELTRATLATPADLQAGYLPDQSYGLAKRWFSTAGKTWVLPKP